METYQHPFSDFLESVIGLNSTIGKARFTVLFVKIFKYLKIEGAHDSI